MVNKKRLCIENRRLNLWYKNMKLQFINKALDYERLLKEKDEALQNNIFSVRREISFSNDKPKTIIIGFKDGLSKKDVKKFRKMLMSGLPHDPEIHKVILMPESQFNSVIETKKEVNIYINGEKHAIND